MFSVSTLLLAAQLCGKRSYEDVASQTFGVLGRCTVMLCLFLINLGYLVAYMNILADVLSSVAGSVIPPGAEPSRDVLLVAVCLLAVLPVSMAVRTSDMMASVSTASISFIATFTVVGSLRWNNPESYLGPRSWQNVFLSQIPSL
jgi:sodium-coupled neutral amino acid transporter 10